MSKLPRAVPENQPIDDSERYENSVGDGWQPIIKPVIDLCIKNGVRISQIKEKFGSLRFYTESVPPPAIATAIRQAEQQCDVTCEQCGKPGTLRNEGWMKTACDEHA